MAPTVKILLALLVLGALGVGAYFLFKKPSNGDKSELALRDRWDAAAPGLGLAPQDAYNFLFKKMCQTKEGTLAWNQSADPTKPYSGTLLSCEQRAPFGQPEVVLASEIADIEAKIASKVYAPTTEQERLALYFELVYPNAPQGKFASMSLPELVSLWQDLELYYKLPAAIMPQTAIPVHRSEEQKFFRMPAGLIIDQDPDRLGITTAFAEVVHAGATSALYTRPDDFNGTYYYPAKGSGIYLPLGRSLVAYNKVHALKMLGVANSDLVQYAGLDFISFLQHDSEAAWKAIRAKDPHAKWSDHWVSTCVIGKHLTKQGAGCKPVFGKMTAQVSYIPAALDQMVSEMASGKSLRTVRVQGKPVLRYYGLGDTGDLELAQVARNRNYETLQLLREAQMSLKGNAVVGNEFLDLVEPTYAQTRLVRLNPFGRPYNVATAPYTQPNLAYLLDATVKPVSMTMLADKTWDPWEANRPQFDVVVPERN